MAGNSFKVGDIVRSDFHWPSTKNQDGDKDRRCMVARVTGGHVVIVPITHRPPEAGRQAVELMPRDKRGTGLDDERNWIIADTANIIPAGDTMAFLRGTGRSLPAHVASAAAKRLDAAVKSGTAWARKIEIDPVQRELMARAAGKSTAPDAASRSEDRSALIARIRDRAAEAHRKGTTIPGTPAGAPRRPTLTIRGRSRDDDRS